jgi:phage-related protein
MTLTFPSIAPTFPATLLIEPKFQGMDLKAKPSISRVIGLSRTPIKRELEFHVNVSNSLTIGDFLFARVRDNNPFYYTHPGDSQRKYVCDKWSRSQTACNDVTIRATFQEFYEYS